MIKKIGYYSVAVLYFIFPVSVWAAVKLPSYFSNGMILQQQSKVAIWGNASKNAGIRLTTSWDGAVYTSKAESDGSWRISISTPKASTEQYSIEINDGEKLEIENILIGEVWLASGQSNMEMPLKGFPNNQPVSNSDSAIRESLNPYIRFFNVTNKSFARPLNNCKGEWLSSSPETSPNFSATAYFFASSLYASLHIPVGIIQADWGGTDINAWMSAKTLADYPEITVKPMADTAYKDKNEPTGLYNGMIHPLLGYMIKGAIWYQGEHNRDEPELYKRLLPAMVNQWRRDWGIGDFPFYYVQIAPFLSSAKNIPVKLKELDPTFAYFREVQALSTRIIGNSGVAILTDAGSEKTVHPPDKKVVGDRLALLALAKTYDNTELAYSGPVYKDLTTKKNKVTIHFNYGEGLYFKNGKSSNFEIAGVDKVFYPANATITKDGVELSSPKVKYPIIARYAYKAWIEGDLYNKFNLPASTFQTDHW